MAEKSIRSFVSTRLMNLISFLITGFLLLFGASVVHSEAQIKIPKDQIRIPVKKPEIPDLDKRLQEEPPVSTTLTDAIFDIDYLDGFDPEQGAFMTFLPLSPQAGFPLLPGLWEGQFQSYCLKAGAYSPGEGSGYALAPLKGKQAEAVSSILKNSVLHPEVKQENIQALLWAIIARCKLSECPQEIQKTARALLTPKEYDQLNGGALGKIPRPVLDAVMQKLPPAAREIFEAEARLREMFSAKVLAPYHEIEKVAVRVGEVLPPPDSRDIPSGRWSYDLEGYFIRFFPSSYQITRVQIYRPENFVIETDEDGLIVSIADQSGTKVNIIYDFSLEPLFFEGDGNVVGLAFKELALTLTGPDGLSRTEKLQNAGWVLAGIPKGGGKAVSGAARYSGASDRYRLLTDQLNEILILKEKLARINPELKNIPDSTAWSLGYLGSYCQAIKLAVQERLGEAEGKPEGQAAAITSLLDRAWMKGLALLANGELSLEETVNLSRTPKVETSKTLRQGFGPMREHVYESLFFFHPEIEESRQLPKFKWIKPQAPKWAQETKPRKRGPHGLPQYIPDKKVAQPGNTGKQRLGQSGRKTTGGNGREAAENTRRMIKWFSTGTSAGQFAAGKVLGTATPYGIPKALASHMIGRTVSLWGDCIDAISVDPPRSDYTILARPEIGSFPPLEPEEGITKARADAVNAYLSAALELSAFLRAARYSVERCSGAMAAGDEEWTSRQLANAIKYERESGLAMVRVAERLEALIKVATSEQIPDIILTPELINNYLRSLSKEGFSPDELEACRRLNLTDEEIEEMKEKILKSESLDGPVSLYDSGLKLARALREFASQLLSLPVIH